MPTLFASKRLSVTPGALLHGEWQYISALESGLVKAQLELLPDTAMFAAMLAWIAVFSR